MSSWTYLIHHFRRFQENNNDILLLVDGEKGCLSEDTEIYVNGKVKALKYILDRTICNTKAYDFSKKVKVNTKCQVFKTGKKKVYELITVYGKKVQATKNHKFFINRNDKMVERKLRDIKVTDIIYTASGLDIVTSITYIGKKDTYDLNVPRYHNFILGNGIITHNSGKSTLALHMVREYVRKFGFICPHCKNEFYKNCYVMEKDGETVRFYIPNDILQDKISLQCPEYWELNLKTGVKEKKSGCGKFFKWSERKRIRWDADKFIAYTNEDAYKKLIRSPQYCPLMFDEAYNFMAADLHNKTESKSLKRLFTVVRPRRLFMIAIIPEIKWIDSKYREVMSHYWVHALTKGVGFVMEKDKSVTKDKWHLDEISALMGVVKYFTSYEKIKRNIKKHPCYWGMVNWGEMDTKIYDEYELVRNAHNIQKEIAENSIDEDDISKMAVYNLLYNWDRVHQMVVQSKKNSMTYDVLRHEILINPLNKKTLVSDTTLRNWVRAVESYVSSKGKTEDKFDSLEQV